MRVLLGISVKKVDVYIYIYYYILLNIYSINHLISKLIYFEPGIFCFKPLTGKNTIARESVMQGFASCHNDCLTAGVGCRNGITGADWL